MYISNEIKLIKETVFSFSHNRIQIYEDRLKKVYYSDKNNWHDVVGYTRAIKCGNVIHISGTVATDTEGNALHKGNAAEQTRSILNKFAEIMSYFGSDISHIVRTRMYTTDISKWEEIGRVHGEFFRTSKPVTTMVEVSNLISPDYIVEIEAKAIVED